LSRTSCLTVCPARIASRRFEGILDLPRVAAFFDEATHIDAIDRACQRLISVRA